jgi:hypothetical protein
VLELGSVTGPDGNCTFRTKITVPNVPPGTYQVSGVSGFGRPQGDAYALSVTTVDFEVDR